MRQPYGLLRRALLLAPLAYSGYNIALDSMEQRRFASAALRRMMPLRCCHMSFIISHAIIGALRAGEPHMPRYSKIFAAVSRGRAPPSAKTIAVHDAVHAYSRVVSPRACRRHFLPLRRFFRDIREYQYTSLFVNIYQPSLFRESSDSHSCQWHEIHTTPARRRAFMSY